MSDYDELFKHVTSEFPRALAELALKTPEVKVEERVSTEQATVRVHRSDMTFHIQLPDEAAILHIEAQTDDSRHKPMPLRMLAYSSFLVHAYEKNVYSTVLYFRPPAGRRDPGVYRYGTPDRGGIQFAYNVIRVYELEGEAFLDPTAIGLLPFTALMKPPAEMSSDAWVEKCIQTTQAAAVDRQMRATLLFALSVFGSLIHPPELFQDPTLEVIMQESPFYQRVIQRGIEQGEIRAKRDAVLKLLQRQLGQIPQPLANRIDAIRQLSQLDTLFEKALTAKSFEEMDWEDTNT